jgi:hypothetical protein
MKENISVLFGVVSSLFGFQYYADYVLNMFWLGDEIFFLNSHPTVTTSYEIYHHVSVGLTPSITPNITNPLTPSLNPITLGQWLLIIYK